MALPNECHEAEMFCPSKTNPINAIEFIFTKIRKATIITVLKIVRFIVYFIVKIF